MISTSHYLAAILADRVGRATWRAAGPLGDLELTSDADPTPGRGDPVRQTRVV
jgi:hypothetical protein